MSKNEIIDKISSQYCLINIFSYINYRYIIILIKNNKKLQNKLNINLKNYKMIFNYDYIEKKIIK